ncbi:MAG: CehA/McbA family metallohydrolase [Anaerolineaceae bacterium]
MTAIIDGPASSLFFPLPLQGKGSASLDRLVDFGVSQPMAAALADAPRGAGVSWGIPFEIKEVIVIKDKPVSITVDPFTARWLVFLHTSDVRPLSPGPGGIISPMRGEGQLAERAADYILLYMDGSQARLAIRRRYQVGPFQRGWGENCFECVPQHKPAPEHAHHEQDGDPYWGLSQTRVLPGTDGGPWMNWLWAWENPHPEKMIAGLRFEPGTGVTIISAITAGNTTTLPLRWQERRKACLRLPDGATFQPELDENGLLKQVQLDLGQVISAALRPLYPVATWPETYNNQVPNISSNEVLLEYTAHPEACFHLAGGQVTVSAVAQLDENQPDSALRPIAPAAQPVRLRVVEHASGKVVPVKLHVHGQWGEYLAPVDRHRILNPAWFEDYSVDFLHVNPADWKCTHACTYINGETTLKLPQGKIYLEVSKGFEIRPLRKVVEVTPNTQEILLEVEKVLPWREKGWVTADTHVHFLSPISAMLEGSAEGVNVVNLLASQWGELMTNVGDFDGKTTWGSPETGGDGEYLVRVGTENRQHVLGHISLLGYHGPIIAPMTTGGPDESAIGDPIEILLTEWARQCRAQGGLVVLPHFPRPRAEHAASIVSGEIDALEMTSWENLYAGLDPYSVSDWYRYLNCGYLVAAVGGTDKMDSATAVGTVRTYARIQPGLEFNYENWKAAVRRGETFVTYGPLLEFSVDGQPMGGRILMPASGGTVDVEWQVSSVTVPVSRVELVINGAICQSVPISTGDSRGHWPVKIDQSCWLGLLVRGHYPDKPEIIAAHSTPVMVNVQGSALLAAADAVTILDQIEGSLAYLDTVGTRAEDRVYKRMRLVLESAHRSLHNRLHQAGQYHEHTQAKEHPEHR